MYSKKPLLVEHYHKALLNDEELEAFEEGFVRGWDESY